MWYGTFGLDTGGMGQFLYALRDREVLLDILEEISGQRMMFNYIRPGGVLDDLPAGIDKKILDVLRRVRRVPGGAPRSCWAATRSSRAG